MRIVALSDTHGLHQNLVLPEGDVLVHAGDFTNLGRPDEVESFRAWLQQQPHEYKIVVPGNHDLCFEDESHRGDLGVDVDLVISESFQIGGVRFHADSHTPEFFNWAFMYPRHSQEAVDRWDYIAPQTEVLITHGPPAWILDQAHRGGHVGCEVLASRLSVLPRLRHHIFGHIHESYGEAIINGVQYHNVAIGGIPGRLCTVIDL